MSADQRVPVTQVDADEVRQVAIKWFEKFK
jgi:hypothetical protein